MERSETGPPEARTSRLPCCRDGGRLTLDPSSPQWLVRRRLRQRELDWQGTTRRGTIPSPHDGPRPH